MKFSFSRNRLGVYYRYLTLIVFFVFDTENFEPQIPSRYCSHNLPCDGRSSFAMAKKNRVLKLLRLKRLRNSSRSLPSQKSTRNISRLSRGVMKSGITFQNSVCGWGWIGDSLKIWCMFIQSQRWGQPRIKKIRYSVWGESRFFHIFTSEDWTSLCSWYSIDWRNYQRARKY